MTVPNPSQSDADFDARGDACDPCPNDPLDDQDGDGLRGNADNCPTVANPGQQNGDADPFGDACDPCPFDEGSGCAPDNDGDGIPNASDPDDDSDGVPDDDGDGAFDPCADGIRTYCDDNCPFDYNVQKRDHDHDGIGDACDPTDNLVQGGTAARATGGGATILAGTATYSFTWESESGVVGYNVYRGSLTALSTGSYGSCYRNRITTRFTTLPENPPVSTGFFYLVAPVYFERDGSLGCRSDGVERVVSPSCP